MENIIINKKCETCGKDFEALADYQKLCRSCYIKNKNGVPTPPKDLKENCNTIVLDKDTKILRQVFLKVASEQVKGRPEELLQYAKKLETEWTNWR